jgi:hypothetical protein
VRSVASIFIDLHQLYLDVAGSGTRVPSQIMARLIPIAERVRSDEYALSAQALRIYHRLIALYCPDLPDVSDVLASASSLADRAEAERLALQAESELRNDPSLASLWLIAAERHRESGNDERAHVLLRRACASGFSVRKPAQRVLADWVAIHYEPTHQKTPHLK